MSHPAMESNGASGKMTDTCKSLRDSRNSHSMRRTPNHKNHWKAVLARLLVFAFATNVVHAPARAQAIQINPPIDGQPPPLTQRQLQKWAGNVALQGDTVLDPATGAASINPTISVSRSQISRLSSDATTATSSEVQTAAQLENATGSTIKMIYPPPGVPGQITPKSPDFAFESGPNAGKTGDFMFSVDANAVPPMNMNFARNWLKTEVSLSDHLAKADVVVLDFRTLNPTNQQMVNNWINTLTPAQRGQLLIVK